MKTHIDMPIHRKLLLGISLLAALALLIITFRYFASRGPLEGAPGIETSVLASDVNGLSGLTATSRGLLAVAERDPVMVELRWDGSALTSVGDLIPIEADGVSIEGVDLEALAAFQRDGHEWLAIGTETHRGPTREGVIFFATREAERVHVTESLILPYAMWSIEAETNKGIEGLCAVDGFLLAAVETVKSDARGRLAPFAVRDLKNARWSPFWLALSSEDGKISSLDCWLDEAGAIQVIAIERHYGVSRLLGFNAPTHHAESSPPLLQPRVVTDLGANMAKLPNLEGIVRLKAREFLLIGDNQGSSVYNDPTHVLHVRPALTTK